MRNHTKLKKGKTLREGSCSFAGFSALAISFILFLFDDWGTWRQESGLCIVKKGFHMQGICLSVLVVLSCLPSSFFRLGSLLQASSIQFPSAECFSSRGFPTNTMSTRHGRSASLTNSPTQHRKDIMYHVKGITQGQIVGLYSFKSFNSLEQFT